MRTEKLAGLDTAIVGGTDGDGGGNGPLVVFLHGFGASGSDLVPLAGELVVPHGTRFAFPEAPLALDHELGPGARAWWRIDLVKLERAIRSGQARDLSREVPVGLVPAREKVIGLLDELDRLLKPSSLVLGGFSQGAMLTLDVALRTQRAFAGLILFSGTLLCEDEWLPLMAARRGLPVFQSHGRQDTLLPFTIAERLKEHLSGAGLSTDFVPFRGGHELPSLVLDGASAFLERVLGG